MAGRRESGKVQEWRGRMKRFEKSTLSVVDFCDDEGVSTASFYQWRKKLDVGKTRSTATCGADAAPRGFAAVRVVGNALVEVRLPGGTQIHVPTADPRMLAAVIRTVARVDLQSVRSVSPSQTGPVDRLSGSRSC